MQENNNYKAQLYMLLYDLEKEVKAEKIPYKDIQNKKQFGEYLLVTRELEAIALLKEILSYDF